MMILQRYRVEKKTITIVNELKGNFRIFAIFVLSPFPPRSSGTVTTDNFTLRYP